MSAQQRMLERFEAEPSRHLDLRLLKFRNRPEGEDPAMLAIELAMSGRTQDAIEVVDEAIARDPEDLDLLLGCGLAAIRGGKLAFAQLVLTRAASADRRWTEPMRHLVHVLEQRGLGARALEVARRAIAAGESDPALLARVRADDRRRAIDTRLAMFRADPDREEPTLLAQALAEASREREALEVIERAIARDDEDADLRVLEARVRAGRGEKELAEAALARAIELAPEWTEPARSLAELQADRGALLEALATLERAIAVSPADAGIGAVRDDVLARMETAGIARPSRPDAALDAMIVTLDPVGEDTRAGFARADTLVDAPAPLPEPAPAPTPRKRSGWLPTFARPSFGSPTPPRLDPPRLPVLRRAH